MHCVDKKKQKEINNGNVIVMLELYWNKEACLLFSSTVFGEVLLLPWRRHHFYYRHAKTLTICNISVIIEDIYLKL